VNKCLIWDFDNTLAYRNGMWTKSLCNVLDHNGYHDYDPEKVRKAFISGFPWHYPGKAHSEYFMGSSWWDFVNRTISRALDEAGLSGLRNKELTLQFKEEYMKISEWHLYDDVIPALDHAAKNNYENIILSNHIPELEELVFGLGISEFFTVIISSANTDYEKPDPRIFREALKGRSGKTFTMIGDNYEADVKGALGCGIDAVLVRKSNEHGYGKYSEDLSGIWRYIE
jgi:putative hydrolase of the HAD superfamily